MKQKGVEEGWSMEQSDVMDRGESLVLTDVVDT